MGRLGAAGRSSIWYHNWSVVSLSPINDPRCFIEQETLPSLPLVLVGSMEKSLN